jgi:hypothetical protein
MDSLAFWLPLLLLFASALIGTALQRRSKDHCLKKFENYLVFIPSLSGKLIEGKLSVFAQGIQIIYSQKVEQNMGLVDSFVLHPAEIEKIPYIIRPAPDPDTRAGVLWNREMSRILHPTIIDRFQRNTLTFYNMLKDAFGQAAKAILGALSKDSSFSQVKDSGKRLEEVRSGLTDLVPNAWEPILEKYRGRRVVIERKATDGSAYDSGVLEDYSSKYLLLREVKLQDSGLLKLLADIHNSKAKHGYDILFSRKFAIIRHTMLDDSSDEEATS